MMPPTCFSLQVWLYDLATARKTAYSSNKPCVSLARVDLLELEEQATAMLAKQSNAAPQPHALTREAPADAGAGMGTAQGRAGARAGQGDIVLRLTNGSPPRGSAGVMQSITNNLFSSPDGSKRSKRQGRGAPGKSPGTAAKQEVCKTTTCNIRYFQPWPAFNLAHTKRHTQR